MQDPQPNTSAIVAHPDRDGILSSALLVRMLGPAVDYQKANAAKLLYALPMQRRRLMETGCWPVGLLLVVDLPCNEIQKLCRELSHWKNAGTQIWLLDHHEWPQESNSQLAALLAPGHPPLPKKETDGAAGLACVNAFGSRSTLDEHGCRLLDMIYSPREMEDDPYARQWYPGIDAAKEFCTPQALGYDAFGRLIEALAFAGELPGEFVPYQQSQRERMSRTDEVVKAFKPMIQHTFSGRHYFIADLRPHHDIDPVRFALAMSRKHIGAHFFISLWPRQIKAALLAGGKAEGLDLRREIVWNGANYSFQGHEAIVTSQELDPALDLPALARAFVDAF